MNYYGNPFNQPFMPMPTYNMPQQQQQAVPQLKTNKIFVTSLEDALSRYAEPNSIMVYRHQDEKMEFEVITDSQGKKNYKTLVLADYSPVNAQSGGGSNIISAEEFEGFKSRLNAIESEVFKNKKQEKKDNE